ncbi:hypothetical protein Tco_0571857, partial [Tanacetum coccineum]
GQVLELADGVIIHPVSLLSLPSHLGLHLSPNVHFAGPSIVLGVPVSPLDSYPGMPQHNPQPPLLSHHLPQFLVLRASNMFPHQDS